MSITLKKSGTTSVTGGTDSVFIAQERRDGTVLMVESGAEIDVRERLTSKISPSIPNVKAPGGKQNARHLVTLGKPIVTTSGDNGANSLQISLSRHPETSKADVGSFIDELVSGLVAGGAIRTLLMDQVHPQ